MSNTNQDKQNAPTDSKPTFLQTLKSILAGLFGVQSHKNRERDFNKGDAGNYIGVYVVMVITLIVGVMIAVSMVLSSV